jgi:nucleotide-binding universal stress UspA family protein
MFNNVLVGVDGTAHGRDAIALASRLKDPEGKLTLAHVHPGEFHPLYAITPDLLAEEHDASVKLLEQERAAGAPEAELVSIVAASAGSGLHRQAEDQGADLLVVGSSGRSALGRAMLGDDTRAALNGSPSAVAIAARGYAAHPKPISRVGVAYNGSPESESALASARELAAANKAGIYALEVISIPSYALTGIMAAPVGDSIDALLAEAGERMGKLADVDGRAVYGNQLDILVVGSRGYGPVRRLVLGSTSDYLERHARCSLLVLPRAGSTTGTP